MARPRAPFSTRRCRTVPTDKAAGALEVQWDASRGGFLQYVGAKGLRPSSSTSVSYISRSLEELAPLVTESSIHNCMSYESYRLILAIEEHARDFDVDLPPKRKPALTSFQLR